MDLFAGAMFSSSPLSDAADCGDLAFGDRAGAGVGDVVAVVADGVGVDDGDDAV